MPPRALNMFSYLSVGQTLRWVRVADKILPRFRVRVGSKLFEHLSQCNHFSE
jgi:hypothetical protein